VSAVTAVVAPIVSTVTTAVAPVVSAVTTVVAPVVSAVTTVVAPAVSAVANPSAGTPAGSLLGASQRSSSEPPSQAGVGAPTGPEPSAALPTQAGQGVGPTPFVASPSARYGLAPASAAGSDTHNRSEGMTFGWSGAANGLRPGGAPSSPLGPLPVPSPGPRLAGCSSSAGLTGSTQLFSRVAAASTLDVLGWRRAPNDRADYRSFRFLLTLDRPG
jgi:hypothetical protein